MRVWRRTSVSVHGLLCTSLSCTVTCQHNKKEMSAKIPLERRPVIGNALSSCYLQAAEVTRSWASSPAAPSVHRIQLNPYIRFLVPHLHWRVNEIKPCASRWRATVSSPSITWIEGQRYLIIMSRPGGELYSSTAAHHA